jgi:hypothetical protein
MNLSAFCNMSFKYLVAAVKLILIATAKYLYGSMKSQPVIPNVLHRSTETVHAFHQKLVYILN